MISSNSHQRLSFILTALCLFLPTTSVWPQESRPQPRLILDADTANEIDDMYAITRTLKQDRFKVLALTSAQWIHYLAEPDSVAASQRENEALVKLLGREKLPTPQGSAELMGKPWGGDEAKDSPAAQFIIQSAKKASPDNKLVVVCLGASTNLASAIKLAPEIAPNIDAYILGFRYDVDANVWNKSSFNIRRDLNAADFVLNCRELDLHIMPANVARPLTFPREPTFAKHESMGQLGEVLDGQMEGSVRGIRELGDVGPGIGRSDSSPRICHAPSCDDAARKCATRDFALRFDRRRSNAFGLLEVSFARTVD